ncbi:glycosyltransferase family 2 protein [Pseudomonas pseudonitroreducens]|uniref:glycosyltransferase family 2 protein n=1 Tax=Pseudomonas pseudonitroreducens TaxID=2892326 RepID=UPI001F1F6D32|nr:glycosyltransferase family 2 protein [Pseudomonas pseudonitroreducens]
MSNPLSLGTRLRILLGIKLGVLEQGNQRFQLTETLELPSSAGKVLPRISIVTPSFNQGRFIASTIGSVLSQGYSNLEYIVQDNQSTDGTFDVLVAEKSSDFQYFVEKDSGQADAINRGFSRCSGEILAFLNSDDILLPGTLAYVARLFQENPEIDAVYGNRVLIDTDDNIVGRWVLPGHDGELMRHIDYIPQETLFWRRDLWERCGARLDDKLAFALDWDLLLRFLDCGARFSHVPHFLGGFRIHQDQKTSSEYGSNGVREMKRIRSRHAPKLLSRALMPFRHFIFLLKHIREDKRLSTFLKAAGK